MTLRPAFLRRKTVLPQPDAASVLNALTSPVLLLDDAGVIQQVNTAVEDLLEMGAAHLVGRRLDALLPPDSPVFALIAQAAETGASVSEHGVTLDSPRTGHRVVTIQVAPLAEIADWIVVSFHEQSLALKIGAQLTHRSSARSVTAMAAILAHEVKNPLSGIRGAAQLLEQSCGPDDRTLTRLICDEADRIVALVDRMEVFTDKRPIDREAVNIHSVLEHVRRVSQAGFARHVRFVETYDPSLPPVFGNRDQLVQVFLNLVKNAAEAVPEEGGEIVLATSFQHSVRLAVQGSSARLHLPLAVAVQDNGPGIPEDLRPHLFDPFVTTKSGGSGLGLALVAKIIDDHGGVIEFDNQPRRTIFRVLLPVVPDRESEP